MTTGPMGELILIDRGRAERLIDLALSYLEYDQTVIDRAAKAIRQSDIADDIAAAPQSDALRSKIRSSILSAQSWQESGVTGTGEHGSTVPGMGRVLDIESAVDRVLAVIAEATP